MIRLNYHSARGSIDGSVTSEELPDFVVLTGPNGSGKSNLLGAIQFGNILIEGVTASHPNQPNPAIKLFSLAQLVVAAETAQSPMAFRDRYLQIESQTNHAIANFTAESDGTIGPEVLESRVQGHLVGSRLVTRSALHRMLQEAGKPLVEFTTNDFRRFAPMLVGIRDPFSLSVGEVFLTYHQRRNRNEFLQWRLATKDSDGEQPLTDEEFEGRHGPPPWDLVNETLKLVGLPYHFNPPIGVEEDLIYDPVLHHDDSSAVVPMDQLSSGEKTLMAIVMSLYTGTRFGEAIEMPEVLLLDEADASLHPSMVRSLLQVTHDIFVQRYGVKVLLTTHSPTTVALAPEGSLFTMARLGQPRIRRATRDDALKSLTVGLPTLSVRTENRRQVIVESQVDEACYQELFLLVRQRLDSPISFDFIASGHGKGGGADNVKRLVTQFRASGNPLVLGILDRDDRGGAPEGIYFLKSRYALENLILDPVIIAAFLLRERLVPAKDLGLEAEIRHFEINAKNAQCIADAVIAAVRADGDDETSLATRYADGMSVDVPRFYLNMNGHDLEARLLEAFKPLRAYRQKLMVTVAQTALRDAPHLIPEDAMSLFQEMQAT